MESGSARLYVGNLPPSATEEDLRDAFAGGGRQVREVRLVEDPATGRPRGFAYVEMASQAEALAALEELDGRPIEGRALHVETAPARPRRTRFVGERWER